jgi:hypothetical protein
MGRPRTAVGPVGRRLLRSGASGYPLNAYLTAAIAPELGLAHDRLLDPEHQLAIAEATPGLIVSAYDAEAFLILISPELDQALTLIA